VEQGSTFSPILSALYLAFVLYILEKHVKILKIPISILSFVDNGLLIAQSKSLTILNNFFFCSYRVISSLLEKFGLILEYGKIEVFHFSRSNDVFDLSPLNLCFGRSHILFQEHIEDIFIFNRKLSFHQHIDHYVNKVILTVKHMKILRNLVCSLIPH